MSKEQFAERMRQLVSEAEDTGLSLPEMIDALVDQAEALLQPVAREKTGRDDRQAQGRARLFPPADGSRGRRIRARPG